MRRSKILYLRDKEFSGAIREISFSGEKSLEIFQKFSKVKQAQILLNLTDQVREKLVVRLSDEELIQIFDHLDPTEITDIVQLISEKRQKEIIEKFNENLRKSVEFLNKFSPESAAGLMSLNYVQVDSEDSIAEVAKQFNVHEKRTGRLPVIFVMDKGELKGYLPVHKLGLAKPSEKCEKFIRKMVVIKHNASHDEVVRIFRNNPHNKVAVIGPEKNVLGVIYSDDILKFLGEGETSALYDFAGLKKEESVLDSAYQKVKNRYKWLVVNLGTAFLAAFTVSLFDGIISKYVLLAVYMPIVAGMGGNAGTQTLAVLVRGIALKQIELKTALPTLKREVIAGIINGLINGLLVGLVVMLLNKDVKIAFILAMAMVINLFVAGFFGTLVPLVMNKLGKDPATSATIFITTATDVLGFMGFLGLATVVLS